MSAPQRVPGRLEKMEKAPSKQAARRTGVQKGSRRELSSPVPKLVLGQRPGPLPNPSDLPTCLFYGVLAVWGHRLVIHLGKKRSVGTASPRRRRSGQVGDVGASVRENLSAQTLSAVGGQPVALGRLSRPPGPEVFWQSG